MDDVQGDWWVIKARLCILATVDMRAQLHALGAHTRAKVEAGVTHLLFKDGRPASYFDAEQASNRTPVRVWLGPEGGRGP